MFRRRRGLGDAAASEGTFIIWSKVRLKALRSPSCPTLDLH